MNIFKDLWAFSNAMSTLPRVIQVWATLYPLPQIVGGLYFIATLPGLVIFLGRVVSSVLASQVHKRSPFSKMIGPISHAHWLLILPYLVYVICTQTLSSPLYWFIVYVLITSLISAVIDFRDLVRYLKSGSSEYKR
jgi:hypothetical protein